MQRHRVVDAELDARLLQRLRHIGAVAGAHDVHLKGVPHSGAFLRQSTIGLGEIARIESGEMAARPDCLAEVRQLHAQNRRL